MKRSLLLAAAASLLLALPASATETSYFARPGRFGLGLGGTNLVSGLTGKFFVAPSFALQATVGYWYGYYGEAGYYPGPTVGLDGIFEMSRLAENDAVSLNWNLGVGATVVLGSPFLGGVEGIVGLGLQIKPVPFEFVLELRPTLLFPGPHYFFFGGGGAIRFFF